MNSLKACRCRLPVTDGWLAFAYSDKTVYRKQRELFFDKYSTGSKQLVHTDAFLWAKISQCLVAQTQNVLCSDCRRFDM